MKMPGICKRGSRARISSRRRDALLMAQRRRFQKLSGRELSLARVHEQGL